ncbi:hypothetical protein QBC39DRAFT_336563 [Podospora conica]|nr:hypothetical protein QBC39DRAFT_336563 [Schizothecium conicum]
MSCLKPFSISARLCFLVSRALMVFVLAWYASSRTSMANFACINMKSLWSLVKRRRRAEILGRGVGFGTAAFAAVVQCELGRGVMA